MKFQYDEIYEGFKLEKQQQIKELDIDGYYFIHEYSGAKLVYLDCQDNNNVFSMTFETLPENHTGVAHIVEHAVCCASKKYPLKDTFMEMDKGSLNTALNACTYKDMTMYYVASQNEKDLNQLIEVYMDLVFNPLIYSDEQLFRQEGWHYSLEDIEDEPCYNGIVYNEMKGVYAEPGARLEKIVHEALFEGTPYAYDSGGVPQEILNLTWEEALAFHKKNYRADNVTFLIYGDGDIHHRMKELDTHYLKNRPKRETVPTQISTNKVNEIQPKEVIGYYPVSSEERAERNYMNMTFVVGDRVEGEKRLAFQILEHILLKSAASPLQEVLVEQYRLATSLAAGGYDPGKKQATFAITLTGCDDNQQGKFKQLFFDVIKQLVTNGINPDLIKAAIDTITFSLYEGESEGEPLGVLYSEDIQLSLNYGGEPFEYLIHEEHLKRMNEESTKGYFENLLKEAFLENSHYVQVTLKPSEQLGIEEEVAENQKIRDYFEKMNKEEREELIVQNRMLEQRQLRENTKEELACLPKLTLKDLKQMRKRIEYKHYTSYDVPIITTIEQTRQISYYHVLLNAKTIQQEYWHYLGVLATILTYVSTESKTYAELENEINSQTGALNCTINAYADTYDTNNYTPYFKISTKMLDVKSKGVINLLYEIMTQSVFNEKDKIYELLKATLYEMERSFTGVPEYRATKYLYTAFSEAARFEDCVSGVAYYYFLKELCEHYDEQFQSLQIHLEHVYKSLMTKSNLKISLTAREEQIQQLIQQSHRLCKGLGEYNHQKTLPVTSKQTYGVNTAFKTSSDVQAVAWGGRLPGEETPFTGAWYVVAQLLESNYLWDKVRLKGGAYGCDLMASRDGTIVICSYCDPQLKKTLKAYTQIGKYLEQVVLDEESLERYIIKTIGLLDYPLTIEQKSERATIHYLCGVKPEILEKEREEILNTTVKDIRKLAGVFKSLAQEAYCCVIGDGTKITRSKQLFDSITKIS